MKLLYVDTCLPGYFGGHHLPVVQVVVDCTTTYQEVLDALKSYEAIDHLEALDLDLDFEKYKLAVDECFRTADLGVSWGATIAKVPEEDLDTTDSVWAFFVIDVDSA